MEYTHAKKNISISIIDTTSTRYFSTGLTFLKVFLTPSKKNILFATMEALWSNEKCFLFHLKSSFRPQVYTFLSWVFGHIDWKDKVNFKLYDVTTWLTNSYNARIPQYLTK